MLSPNGIRAILFDLDGTLRYNEPSPEQTFFDCAVDLGVLDSPEKRRRAIRWVHYYWAQSPEMLQDVQTYKDSDRDFWFNYTRLHLSAFECPEEMLEEIAPVVFRYMDETYKPQDRVMPGVLDTLQNLKGAGFSLGVVSNRTKPFLEQLAALELAPYFECVVAAGEIESWKPEPEIFYHALEKMELKAAETIYVGDNYYADVVGAQRAGLCPVLLDPDGVFPDAGCKVLNSVMELKNLLEQR